MPGIIRSIYAYHVKSRGWSDIGYNFLVDRFGRIWEGRYGGIDKPVVGAHTLGYNDYAFAMSAIGNFDARPAARGDARRPTARSSPGSSACTASTPPRCPQQVGRTTFAAINGHRDAGSTACPGKYLYAKIPTIRTHAAAGAPAPAPTPPPPAPTTRDDRRPAPQSNLVGAPYPDLVVRRAARRRGFVVPTGGLTAFAEATTVVDQGLEGQAGRPRHPRRHRRRARSTWSSTSRRACSRIRPGTGDGTFKADRPR